MQLLLNIEIYTSYTYGNVGSAPCSYLLIWRAVELAHCTIIDLCCAHLVSSRRLLLLYGLQLMLLVPAVVCMTLHECCNEHAESFGYLYMQVSFLFVSGTSRVCNTLASAAVP